MSLRENMRIRTRLWLVFLLVTLAVLLAGSYVNSVIVAEDQKDNLLEDLKFSLEAQRGNLRLLLLGDEDALQAIGDTHRFIQGRINELHPVMSGDELERLRELEEISQAVYDKKVNPADPGSTLSLIRTRQETLKNFSDKNNRVVLWYHEYQHQWEDESTTRLLTRMFIRRIDQRTLITGFNPNRENASEVLAQFRTVNDQIAKDLAYLLRHELDLMLAAVPATERAPHFTNLQPVFDTLASASGTIDLTTSIDEMRRLTLDTLAKVDAAGYYKGERHDVTNLGNDLTSVEVLLTLLEMQQGIRVDTESYIGTWQAIIIQREEYFTPEHDRFSRIVDSLTLEERGLKTSYTAFFLLIFLGLAGFVIAVGTVVSMAFTRPLERLEQAAETITTGNLDVYIPITGRDEITNLAKQMDIMRKELKKSRGSLESQIQNRTSELQSSLEKQKYLEDVKDEFLTVASHELRTPLTPMMAQLQMLLLEDFGKLTSEQKKSLTMVLRNSAHLNSLISDVVDISNLQAGVMKFLMKEDNLNRVVREAVDTMMAEAEAKGVALQLKSKRVNQAVFDKDRMTQVLLNLITNALKFTEKGKITVTVSEEKGQAVIEVSDTGIGIKKGDLKKIFKPFVQGETGAGRHYEGTGLGLAICRGIMKEHGGTITVESEPGKGSTFTITLPYKGNGIKGVSKAEIFKAEHKEQALTGHEQHKGRTYGENHDCG